MRILHILLLLLLVLPAMAQFGGAPVSPGEALRLQMMGALQVLVALMFVMVVLAAVVYVAGQFFGAETRAKASVWVQGMLAAVGVSAAVVIMLYVIVPGFVTGTVPTWDVVGLIGDLTGMAQTALAVMTVVMLVLAAVIYAAGQLFGGESQAPTVVYSPGHVFGPGGRGRATAWASGLVAGAIAAAVIYVVLSQILIGVGGEFFRGTELGLYAQVIVQIVFFVALFILITYLVSRFFKVPEWEAYLNIELSNLMAAFIIVIFFVAFFAASGVIVGVLSGDPSLSPPLVAVKYMQGTVADSTLRAMVDVYKINACTSMLSMISRRIGEYVLTQTYKIFPGIDTFVSITNMLGFTLITIYSTISVQIDFLYLINATMLHFVLPAGLILRFIPPLRDSGAFLIALAFGLQIVFPTTYVINKQIFEQVGAEPYKSPELLIQSLCGPFKYGVAGFLFNPAANPIFSMMPGGQAIGTFLSRLVSESLLNAVSMAEFIPIMRHMAVVSLLGLFIPALSMTVTIAFINAMTKFIVSKV